MLSPNELTVDERDSVDIASQLQRDGDLWSVVALLPAGERGQERLRAALLVLAELDPELVVDLAVVAVADTLIDAG